MITAAQLRAARALLGIDQRQLAALAELSVPTIQRMEASDGVIRGNVDSLMKLIAALDAAGIELIGEGAVSRDGGRGVRLKAPSTDAAVRLATRSRQSLGGLKASDAGRRAAVVRRGPARRRAVGHRDRPAPRRLALGLRRQPRRVPGRVHHRALAAARRSGAGIGR